MRVYFLSLDFWKKEYIWKNKLYEPFTEFQGEVLSLLSILQH